MLGGGACAAGLAAHGGGMAAGGAGMAGGTSMAGGAGANAVSAATGGLGSNSTFSASALALDPNNLNIPQAVASKMFKETISLNKTKNEMAEKQG